MDLGSRPAHARLDGCRRARYRSVFERIPQPIRFFWRDRPARGWQTALSSRAGMGFSGPYAAHRERSARIGLNRPLSLEREAKERKAHALGLAADPQDPRTKRERL